MHTEGDAMQFEPQTWAFILVYCEYEMMSLGYIKMQHTGVSSPVSVDPWICGSKIPPPIAQITYLWVFANPSSAFGPVLGACPLTQERYLNSGMTLFISLSVFQVSVDIGNSSLRVTMLEGSEQRVLMEGTLTHKINTESSVWSLEPGKCILVSSAFSSKLHLSTCTTWLGQAMLFQNPRDMSCFGFPGQIQKFIWKR